jgi:hypothetical protein
MNVRWIRASNPPFLCYGAKEIDDKKIAKKMAKVDVNIAFIERKRPTQPSIFP